MHFFFESANLSEYQNPLQDSEVRRDEFGVDWIERSRNSTTDRIRKPQSNKLTFLKYTRSEDRNLDRVVR
ncbi:hypothetical protein CKA32_001826 [Geitlerinema sp. FC II]|nr:hypothetical protein CKA32_001826 [Geitlerinema sp. FC II]